MFRRSLRLASNGYYISDEKSNSSTVPVISYRENPFRVFKRRARKRKAGSCTSTPAKKKAPSASPEPQVAVGQYDDLSPSTSRAEGQTLLNLSTIITGLFLFILLFCGLVNYRMDSHTSVASLRLRIQGLEAQTAKLSQEWSFGQPMFPPTPCPDTSTNPVHNYLTPELEQAMEKWLIDRIKEQDVIRLTGSCSDCGHPMADKMADFALETQGASVISARCSDTYSFRSACAALFGLPLWYTFKGPSTVIQGSSVLLPGKCWAFSGSQGTLVISLSYPITITHVTLDHLPRYKSPTGRIDSAPKDFEVYGIKNGKEGTLLGTFTYDENGESVQTFKLPNPSDVVYCGVELRVLTNWGNLKYTCLYRFRVHGQISDRQTDLTTDLSPTVM